MKEKQKQFTEMIQKIKEGESSSGEDDEDDENWSSEEE
jgi:hypothetical protein